MQRNPYPLNRTTYLLPFADYYVEEDGWCRLRSNKQQQRVKTVHELKIKDMEQMASDAMESLATAVGEVSQSCRVHCAQGFQTFSDLA